MPFHSETNQTSKKQPSSPSASSAVHTEIKTMSSVSANMVLILARPSLRSHPSRGEALKRQRDREETWRDRHSRSTTTLTARSPHFRFRGTDPELHVPLLLCGYLSRKKAASRKFRGLKARAGPSLARVGNTVRSEDGGVVERILLRWCVSCSPSPLAYLTTRILSCGVWTSPSAPPPWPKSQANTPGFGCSPSGEAGRAKLVKISLYYAGGGRRLHT